MSVLRHLVLATLLPCLWLLSACQKPPVQPEPPQVELPPEPKHLGHLTDFGEQQLARLSRQLNSGQVVHIVQLGDSHTAADFFTDHLRQVLQRDFGNAGPGWLPPARIRGQRSATLNPGPADERWELSSSRLASEPGDWPLGGFMLSPVQENASLQLAGYQNERTRFNLRTLYRSKADTGLILNGQEHLLPASPAWQWSATLPTQLPIDIQTDGQLPGPELGGWLLDNGQPGILFSTLGINGATARMHQRWDPQWQQQLQALQPNLLILAYGTNEAFNDDLDLAAYRQDLNHLIRQLRKHHPQAALLLIGPPDSIRHADQNSCSVRMPALLPAVRDSLRDVARQQRALFWDWQAFMGGPCALQSWQADELAQRDGVHLTRSGYEQSAQGLYLDLKHWLGESP